MTIKGQNFPSKKNNLPAPPAKDQSMIPESIASHPQKRDIWVFLEEDLKARGIYSPTYTFVLQEITETAYRLNASRASLDQEGDMVPRYDRFGNECGQMANPRFAQMLQLQTALMKLMEKVGMSPRDIVFLQHSEGNFDDIIEETDSPKKINYFR